MANSDIVLSAGIKFNPRDVDTRAIKDAVVRALATTRIEIKRVRIGREAQSVLEDAIRRINFRIEQARFGRQGLSSLRQQFRQNEFSVDKVAFSNRALSSLNRQLKKTPFEIATAQPAQSRGAGAGIGAQDIRQQTSDLRTFNEVASEQRAGFLRTQRDLEGLIAGTTRAERSQRNYLQSVAQGSVSLQGFGANIVKITQRFSAYLVSIKAILAAQQAFSASLSFIFEFDSALQNLVKVIDTTKISLGDVSEGLFNVANQTGNAVTAVAEATNQFVRQGLTVPEALERSRAALIGVNAANISVSDSTKLVTVALRVFGDEIGDAVEALDILNITGDNAATTQDQIVQGILRSGSAAKAVGVSFGELNAIIAATVEQTQLSGNQIGSALKTIFARLATNTSGLIEQANALGANIVPGEGLLSTLQKIADVFPRLTRSQQAQIITLAAGKRRFTEFSAILQQLQRDSNGVSRIQELLNFQLDASGNTAAKNEAELAKLSTRAQQTANAFSEFISVLTETGGGGTGIAGTIGEILDTFTDFGNALTDGVRSAKEFGSEFINAFSIIKNIGKSALFVTVPTVLRSIVAGAKTFLGIGSNLSRVLASTGQAQVQFNQALRTGVGQAAQEAEALSRSTRELERQVSLRGQLNQSGQGGVQTTGVTGQADRLAQLRGRENAGLGRGAGGGFSRTLDRLRSGFTRVVDSLTRTRGGIDNFGVRIGLTTVALQGIDAIGVAVRGFSDDLRARGDAVGASLLDISNSAVSTGAQFALLGGPLAGLIAAVTTAGSSLAKLAIETSAEADAASRAVIDLGSLRVAFGEIERTGSQELVEAFKELSEAARSTDLGTISTAVVSDSQLVSRTLQLLASESSTLNQAFRKSGEVLTEVTNQVARILTEARIDERAAEAVSNFQQRVQEAQQPAGADAGPFAEVARLNAQIQTEIAGQNTQLQSQEDILNKIQGLHLAIDLNTKSALEKAELQVGTADELLRRTQAEDQLITKLRSERDGLKILIEEEGEALKENLASNESMARLLERLNLRQKSAVDQAKFFSNINQEINRILKDENASAKQIEEVQKRIAGTTQNINDATKQLAEVEELLNKRVDSRKTQLEGVQSLIRAQTAAVQTANVELERSVQTQRRTNSLAEEQAQLQIQVARQQASTNSFAEQVALTSAQINVERQRELALNQQNLRATIEILSNTRALQQALGDTEGVRAIDAQISRARELFEVQSQEIERKFNIEVNARLAQQSLTALQNAETTLRNFRIQQIQDVLNQEKEATQRRIDLLQRLGDSDVGRQFVRGQGLRGRTGDERDFGVITAAILRQFEEQGSRTITALDNKLDQLRVNGINTFQELNELKEREAGLNREIATLLRSGADPARLAAARQELVAVSESLEQIKDRGISSAQELTEVTNALAEQRTVKEEVLARRREAALTQVERAAERANEAEKALVDARNQVPASNQKIIQAQRNLAQAEIRVEQATRSLSDANQQLADANFQLAFDLGLAEFRARQAAGGFSSVQEAISSLQGAFDNAVQEARASFETILSARREVLQEEVSLVQNQLQSLRGLTQRAFTADLDQLFELQQAASIAAGVQSGQLGAQDLLQLPPELRQSLSGLTSIFPALQQAIDEVGANLIGLDPAVFKTLEQQLVDLQIGIAETGQIQVEKAEEGIQIARQQLEESRSAKDFAQQQLSNSIAQKEALLANAAAAAQNVAATRAGFREQVSRSGQILAQARRGAESNIKLEAKQAELVEGIRRDAEAAAKILDINTELAGLQKTQLIPATQDIQNATKDTANNIAENVRATISVESRIAEVGNSIIRSLVDLGNSFRNFISKANFSGIRNNATGTLSSSEINGLLRAASLEKRAMPGGAKLMLANTSETVLTKGQAKSFGLSPTAKSHAQGGNAVVDGQAFTAIASELGNLNTQLRQIASRAASPQQVNVSIDSSRSITVEGINNLQSSLQDIITQRLGNTPSQAEVNIINQTIIDIVNRMKESGNENFQNL